MRFIVTGAKGFVGSIFSLRAIERGHDVLALDDESRGLNPIEERIGNAYQKHDCSEGLLDPAVARGWDKTDVVVHLAAATGSLDRPIDDLRYWNVYMTKRVYEDALRLDARRFLWPTTSLALGVPDSPYVQSKEEALTWLKEVDEHTRISTPVRFFNLAGAYKGLSERRRNEVHMLPTMLRAFLERKPFIVNGSDYETIDGTPSRSYVHILDAVEYLLDICEGKVKPMPHGQTGIYQTDPVTGKNVDPPADGAIWLGHGRPITVMQAIQIFEQFMGPLQYRLGERRAFDCGGLSCAVGQAMQFEAARNYMLAPTWVTFRDELEALYEVVREKFPNARDVASHTADDEGIEQHASVGVLPQG